MGDWIILSGTVHYFLAVLMCGASMLFFFAALEHLDVTVGSFSL
jgi:preprotein translocase subunit SecE